MKLEFMPKDLKGKLTHVVEECAEVIKAAMKIQRFGMNSTHPDYHNGATNIQVLLDEMCDVNTTIQIFRDALEEDWSEEETKRGT